MVVEYILKFNDGGHQTRQGDTQVSPGTTNPPFIHCSLALDLSCLINNNRYHIASFGVSRIQCSLDLRITLHEMKGFQK
jgi:hypothetical protein